PKIKLLLYKGGWLRRYGVVVIAQRSGELPHPIFVLPEMDKAGLTGSVRSFSPLMHEAVHASLDRSVDLHVVNPQRPRDQHRLRVACADIVLHAFGQRRVAESDAALVVIELHVVG